MDSLICEYIDAVNMASQSCRSCFNFLFSLSVRHIGRMNTQVQLLDSWVRLVGLFEFVGSMHNMEQSKMFISSPCQNRRIAECSLPELQNAWKLQSFPQSVMWIHCQSNLSFCVDDEKETLGKPYHGLPQASQGKKTAGGMCHRLHSICLGGQGTGKSGCVGENRFRLTKHLFLNWFCC